jgi:DNA-binding PadR family transcriptional regulator
VYVDILALSHLADRPAHGYELRRRVEASTGFRLHNNALYPALRRFEDGGAVTKTAVPQQGRPPKHIYEITGPGRELLHDMLADCTPEQAGDDAEFFSRFAQFDYLTPDERLGVLDARDEALSRRLAHLAAMKEKAQARTWAVLGVEELARRAQRERVWLAGIRSHASDTSTAAGDGGEGA